MIDYIDISMYSSIVLFIYLILLKCNTHREKKINYVANYERYKYYSDAV